MLTIISAHCFIRNDLFVFSNSKEKSTNLLCFLIFLSTSFLVLHRTKKFHEKRNWRFVTKLQSSQISSQKQNLFNEHVFSQQAWNKNNFYLGLNQQFTNLSIKTQKSCI